jgi:hypothetical protein
MAHYWLLVHRPPRTFATAQRVAAVYVPYVCATGHY